MDKNIRRFIKMGLVHFMAFPEVQKGYGPIAETIERIAQDDYFDVVEVAQIKDASERKRVRRIVELARMELCYAAMPSQKLSGININDSDEWKRKSAVETIKESIDQAFDLGASAFAFMSGKYDPQNVETHYQALIRSTREICDYTASKGPMRMSLEVFDHDVDNCSLIGPVSLAKRYSDEICPGYPQFGLMVDLSHLPQLRETPTESLIPVQDHINHAHVGNCLVSDKNNPIYGDKHPHFGYPGSSNDVREVVEYLNVLMQIGYLNGEEPRNLSVEVRPTNSSEDPWLVIANAKRTLNRAWALL